MLTHRLGIVDEGMDEDIPGFAELEPMPDGRYSLD